MTSTFVTKYIADLCASSEEQSHLIQLKLKADLVKPAQRIIRKKSLTQQIEELMQSMPPKMLNRPWSMAELVLRLEGKYKARPHSQNIGDALRKAGWRSRRLWGKEWGGLRLWLPPGS